MLTQATQWMATGREDGDQVVHDLVLAYDPALPHAVQLCFPLDEEDPDLALVWQIDRTLLTAALASWGGEGDVRIQVWAPQPTLVRVTLRDAETGQWGRYLARRGDLTVFLERTFEAVPAGAERLNIDAGLQELLAGEGS